MKLLSSTRFLRLMCIGLPLLIVVSCKKNDSAPPPTAPAVTTTPLTNITTSSATTGGTILTDGNAAITKSGIVWSKTNATPTLTDSVMAGTTSKGSFTTNLTGLDFNTVYYIRAFATNSVGTGYGDVLKLSTANDTSKVRFTYNGNVVIYGIIISPTTGKKWLDRNLGAIQAATAYDDYKGYGDLFQWGRPADGHQLINWTSSTTGAAINGTTQVLATSDTPAHSNYIINAYTGTSQWDWRSDNNSNRWTINPQGPCPAGWHVPTIDEWKAEISTTNGGTATSGGMKDRNTAYSLLKLTAAGLRYVDGPNVVRFYQIGNAGFYWSTTTYDEYDDNGNVFHEDKNFEFVAVGQQARSSALSVRCLIN